MTTFSSKEHWEKQWYHQPSNNRRELADIVELNQANNYSLPTYPSYTVTIQKEYWYSEVQKINPRKRCISSEQYNTSSKRKHPIIWSRNSWKTYENTENPYETQQLQLTVPKEGKEAQSELMTPRTSSNPPQKQPIDTSLQDRNDQRPEGTSIRHKSFWNIITGKKDLKTLKQFLLRIKNDSAPLLLPREQISTNYNVNKG